MLFCLECLFLFLLGYAEGFESCGFFGGCFFGGPLDASDSELEEEEADAMDWKSSSSSFGGGA